MKRINQAILIVSFIPFCWLAMMGVHELGHIIVAHFSGGTVTKVVLHPYAISRTDVSPNPSPLLVAWGGPLIGIVLPLMIWGIMSRFNMPGDYLARFFAGFCLIANGAYLGIGSFDRVGDAGDMIQNGSPYWQLWLFGLIAIPFGLLIWHTLGPRRLGNRQSGEFVERLPPELGTGPSHGLSWILYVGKSCPNTMKTQTCKNWSPF